MILAAILSLGMFCAGKPCSVASYSEISRTAASTWPQSEQQPPTDAKSTDSQAASSPTAQSPQPQSAAKPKVTPPSSAGAAPRKPAAAKRPHSSQSRAHAQARTKTTTPCQLAADKNDKSANKNDNNESKAPPTAGQPSATASETSVPSAVPAAAEASPAPDLPPCPPAKVVVRNGGTAEAEVQLTGGSAPPKNSPQVANTNHLLESTEEALNKINAAQLSAGQQETVKQARQYVSQSKEALEAGNLELARNLAVKAHLLTNQMQKPQP